MYAYFVAVTGREERVQSYGNLSKLFLTKFVKVSQASARLSPLSKLYNEPSLRPPLPVLIVSSSSRSLYERTCHALTGGRGRLCAAAWWNQRENVARARRKCIPMTYFQPMKSQY